jgi:organic radical activating enzyme
MSPEDVFRRVVEAADAIKAKLVVLTGGEPTAFKYWEPLIQGLMGLGKFERCVVETNGSTKEILIPRYLHDVTFSIAPKIATWRPDIYKDVDSYLKLTVGPDSLEINDNAISQFLALRKDVQVYIQPCDMSSVTGSAKFTYAESYAYFLELCERYPKADLRMGIQAHKVWGVR